jgi:tRNA dimethylallyltransferase
MTPRAEASGAAGARRSAAPPLLALFGATALGKSAVALALAARLGAEIVAADSMQVYEGLPILTNQPTAEQSAAAPHHLIGFVPPQREFTVAEYAREAHTVIDRLLSEGRATILEGGSGLYLRAALGDLEFASPPDAVLRRKLEARWSRDSGEVVDELRRVDPAALARLDVANPRRVVRALEAALVRGEPLPAAAAGHLWTPGERYDHCLVALEPDDSRDTLTARIETRVDEMLAAGALDEVARARARGPLSRTACQAIGVRELSAVLDGGLGLEEAATRMKARTRALARRQLTWMRKLPAATRVPAAGRPPEAVAEDVFALARTLPW